METRHVQAIGDRSFSITLPKNWIMKNHIKAKSLLFIEETQNGDLILKKNEARMISKKGSINLDKIRSLQERIVFYYTKNVTEITITSKKPFDFKIRKEIRTILEGLEGYKITDETKNSMEIRFLYKEITVTIPQIMRRIVYLLKLMHEALKEKDYEAASNAENSIDRLYHLSERLIFNCLNNSREQEVHGINNEEELFHTKDIIRRLEVISDMIILIAKDNYDNKDLEYMHALINHVEEIIVRKGDQHDVKQALETMEHTSKDKAIEARLTRIRDLAIDVVTSAMDIRFSKEFYDQK